MPITDSNLEGMFTFETDAKRAADEPPFHVLFLGDWSGDGPKRDLGDRRPVFIDRDNFDQVMERLGVALKLELGGRTLEIGFRELDDFHPDGLFRNLPVFAELRDVRRRLRAADTFDEAAGEVRSWFAAPEPEKPKTTAGAEPLSLDDILAGAGKARTEESDLSRLISDVVAPYIVKVDENEQSKLTGAVDAAISELMRKILHNDRFRQLESAWRGLLFAVRRIDTDVDLKLYILDLAQSELVDNLKQVNNLADTVVYREVIRERLETPGADPFSLICGNYSFGADVEDIAALMRMGRLARGSDAPFVSMIRPEMFGISSFAKLPEPSTFGLRDNTNQGKLWSALRSVPEAGYLGLIPMRFLSRVPYGNGSEPVDTFEFEEFVASPEHEDYLWANPSFVCAVLLAMSFNRSAWDMGDALLRDLEKLPLYHYMADGESVLKPCAESLMTEVISQRLLENGLMPLISYRDSDRIRLARFQSVSSPPSALGGRWNR